MRVNIPGFSYSSWVAMVVALVSWLPGKLEAEDPVSKTALKEAVSRGSKLIVGMQENLGAKSSPSSEWPYEGVYRVRSPGKRRGMIPIGYRVGGTAICSWALLKTPGYRSSKSAQAAVKRGRDFVVAALKEPLMSPGFNSTYDVRGWGHAYALQFLLEARGSGKLGSRRAYDCLLYTSDAADE